MSMREQPGEGRGNSFSNTATKAATLIDEQLHWGADTVSKMAHQTADSFGKATDFVQNQGKKIRETATHLTEVGKQNPVYVIVGVGVIGFTLGFLLRGSRRAA
jgi:hypothetical protein